MPSHLPSPLPSLSPADFSSFCAQLSAESRAIALKHFRSKVAYERKDDLTPVTIADQGIEIRMREMIAERFPDHGVVGEEFEPSFGERFTWYLDPIDGTKSFITGMPLFGSLMALYDGAAERVVWGVVDMHVLDERWEGDGAETRFNGAPARCSDCEALENAQIYCTSPDFFSAEEWRVYDRLSRRALYRRFGGDCYVYGMLASGWIDLVVEVSLKPFDFMPLIPVIEGAGGVITDWRGRPLTPESDGRIVAAATPALHAAALAVMSEDAA